MEVLMKAGGVAMQQSRLVTKSDSIMSMFKKLDKHVLQTKLVMFN